jgi:hypothetical protein
VEEEGTVAEVAVAADVAAAAAVGDKESMRKNK